MTYRIGVLSLDPDFEGSTAEHFEPGSFLTSFDIFSEVDAMNNGVAEFSSNPGDEICVRLRATNGSVLRTGVRDAGDVGEMDGSVLELPYLIQPISEEVLYTDLTSGLPLPMTINDLTLSSLTLGRSGQNFVATGTAIYDAGFLGNVTGTLTYEFQLVPVTAAASDALLRVETIDVNVNFSGVVGWLVNAVINLLIDLFEDRIGNELEDVIMDQIDVAIQDALDDAGDVPDHIQVTVQDVTLDGSGATIDALVAVPARSVDCPFEVANGSVKFRKRDQLRKLRRMRSQVLSGNPRGETYIALMRRHGRELARIMRRNPELLKEFDALIAAGLEHFDEERPGDGRLGKRTANRARSLAAKVQAEARPELARAIERTLPDLDDFTGKSVAKVLDDSAAELAKVADKRPSRRRR